MSKQSEESPKEESRSEKENSPELPKERRFPIVAIGASAGGLEVFEVFFKMMPPDNGMAFVLIAHLEPEHHSLLPEILQKRTVMKVHQIDELPKYVWYLQESDREVDILFKELLIGVTHFFRDPEAFQFIKQNTLPRLLKEKSDHDTVRIWVPGCSSGEEAYSLAIILHEWMTTFKRRFKVRIFATDIDEETINTARSGVYAANISTNVSSGRLERYFIREQDGRYRANNSIREMLIFAPQNVIKDPPFTKLDMISCRNLLIYFGPELQKKLFPIFHYSLRAGGILFLGASEAIGPALRRD